MAKENKENIKELLAQFFSASDAAKVASDIVAGEKIFEENRDPSPAAEILKNIENNIANKIKITRRRRIFFRQAAAAAIIFTIGIAAVFFARQADSPSADFFWQDKFDDELENHISQIEQVDLGMPVITLEANGNDMSAINDLTDDFDEIQGTFWEG